MSQCRKAFTLVEILIVVVIMAVLAATIIPQFTASTKDAQEATAIFNLNALRSQIQMYRTQHGGSPPATLSLLTVKTNSNHTTTGTPTLGPYLLRIPENSFNGQSGVGTTGATPAIDATATVGWLYEAATGKVYLNYTGYLSE
jgi:general secretion pathway protein G